MVLDFRDDPPRLRPASRLVLKTTVTLTITQQAPVAVNDAYTTVGQLVVPQPTGVLSNDADADDLPGSLSASVVSTTTHGTLSLAADGSFVYTPFGGYSGTDTFTYRVFDGTAFSDAATVTITLPNQPPVAFDDAYTGHGTVTATAATGVRANDKDPDNPTNTLIVSLVSGPATGTLTPNADGSFSYVPPAVFTGVVTFTYRVSDGALFSNVATATITIVNGAPIAVNDAATVFGPTTVDVAVLANDSDPDLDAIQIVGFTQPAHGTVVAGPNNTLTYTPNAGFVGVDTFVYSIKDTYGAQARATVTITAVPNRVPVCSLAAPSQGMLWPPNHKKVDPITIKGVTDPDGDPLTITIKYIWQDEPTDTWGDGAFDIDGWGVGTSTATVRRERQGTRSTPPGDGRVYEIGFEASDGVASCTGKVFVGIPHDQGNGGKPGSRIAVDSKWRWDSTVPNGPSLNGGPVYPVRPGGHGGSDDGDKKK